MVDAITKASALKLARQKYGQSVEVRHDPDALVAAQKDRSRDEYLGNCARRDLLARELERMGDTRKVLRGAARFAVDVDGDEPSWTQLREALECEEHAAAIMEEIQAIEDAHRRGPRLYRYRWEVIEIVNNEGVTGEYVRARADTLEELMRQLESR